MSLGGVLGSLLRWQIIEALPSQMWGVFLVNQLGVLAAGFVAYRIAPTQQQKLFWITGFAGGFTTMSSLAFVLQELSPATAILYSAATLLVSLALLTLLKPRSSQ